LSALRRGLPLVVSVLAVLFAILMFEAGTRLLGVRFPSLAPIATSDRNLWVYNPTKGWFHAPGAHGQSTLGGPDRGEITINSLGLRGPEVGPKQEGVRRVLVFGDSFVFGIGVDEPHLLTTQLAHMLGPSAEVVNLGVSGYSTDQELILFQELGPPLEPDLVILVACDNDFDGNLEDLEYEHYYKPYFELSSQGALVLRGSPVPQLGSGQNVRLWLAEHSNTWNLVRSRHTTTPLLRPLLDAFKVGVPHRSAADPVALMATLVDAFQKEADELGAAFLTFNTGHHNERTGLFQSLRPRLRERGIHFLGLEANLAAARREHPRGLWDFGGDPHWNVDAERLVAEVVATDLARAAPWQPHAR
jgi:hypothetical protein